MKITARFYKAYPELALFSSDEERIATLKSFHRGMMRKRLFWLTCLGLAGVNAAASAVSFRVVVPMIPRDVMMVALPAVLGACWGIAFQYAWRRPTQQHLRQQLLARGVPICLQCGYDLRGQTEARCPECGRPFVVRAKEDAETR